MIRVSFPLDHDGFIRRECPKCGQQFKWHHGPANEEAESQPVATTYFCPYCGVAAASDQWLTAEQVEYRHGIELAAALNALNDELPSLFRRMSNRNIQIKKTGNLDVPSEPDPLTEPDDMIIVASPCHGWEPVKVLDHTVSPLFCLVCGAAFGL